MTMTMTKTPPRRRRQGRTHNPRAYATKLAVHRKKDRPRVYLEGEWLTRLGFYPGSTVYPHYKQGEITLRPGTEGLRVGHKAGLAATIDLNSDVVGFCLGDAEKVSVRASHGRIRICTDRKPPGNPPNPPNPPGDRPGGPA